MTQEGHHRLTSWQAALWPHWAHHGLKRMTVHEQGRPRRPHFEQGSKNKTKPLQMRTMENKKLNADAYDETILQREAQARKSRIHSYPQFP